MQISDCHLFAERDKTAYGTIQPYLSLGNILRNIIQLSPDLVLVTGDLSGDASDASYRHFLSLWLESGLGCQFVVLPGNHDDPCAMANVFAAENLWMHYSPLNPLTLGKWQFPLLNTKTDTTMGHLDDLQFAQLGELLNSNSDKYQLIAVHHHPIPCDAWMDKHGWDNGSALVELIAQHDSVKSVIYGHIHHASEQQIDQCWYMSCPSSCWQWAMQREFALSSEKPGYRILYLGDSGALETQIGRME